MANKIKAITVEQLHVACGMLIRKGMGKRHILVTDDDEGNGYNELFCGFSPVTDTFPDESILPYGVTQDVAEKEYITLG